MKLSITIYESIDKERINPIDTEIDFDTMTEMDTARALRAWSPFISELIIRGTNTFHGYDNAVTYEFSDGEFWCIASADHDSPASIPGLVNALRATR